MPECDLLIKNARIVDGTGAPAFEGAVAVSGERIQAVGRVEGELRVDAAEVIDAKRLVVSPGFIDAHNHGDCSILYYPRAESWVRQGVTTFVGGNCGTSPGPYGDYVDAAYFLYDLYWRIAPDMYYGERLQPIDKVNELHREMYGWEIDWGTLGEWMDRVEAKGTSANLVPIAGHGDIRYLVMGLDYRRKATKKEITVMMEHVGRAMEDGCRGMSVGRDYNPGYWAEMSELVACAEIAAKYGGIYTSHSLRTGLREDRRPGDPVPPKIGGVLEAIEVGRRAKIPVEVSHLSPLYDVYPPGNKEMAEASAKATLKAIDEAREEGLDVNFDLIPNTTGGIYSTPYLASALMPWLRIAGSLDQLGKALAMPALREEIKATIMSGKWYNLNPNLIPNWAMGPTVVECEEEGFRGKTIVQIARELKVEDLDALMEVLRVDPHTRANMAGGVPGFMMLVKHPAAMIGVDTFGVDDKWEIKTPPGILPNENTFGGHPRYLRTCVREAKILTLEEAIRKITSLPAAKFRLRDRGVLREGAYADITIFNPTTVTDRGNTLNPRVYPRGIEYVAVNGKLVVAKAKHTGETPGKVLRRE
jgi:N-acyl-D-aspartate/D-glutamate deacylase